MIKLKHNTIQIILITAIVLSFTIFNILNNSFSSERKISDEKPITIDANIVRALSLGNPKLISSYLWTLTMLQSDIDHTKKERSWMFYRFQSISTLDPLFFENYLYGGLYLSIIKDDLRGAEEHYQRGLDFFPDSIDLLWNAGFNLCFELKECNKAIPYFQKLLSIDKGKRFKYLSQILSKILANENSDELAYNILLTSYTQMPSGSVKERIHKTLYSLKAKIDLKCLNSQNSNMCNKYDFEGNLYYKQDGIFRSKFENIDKYLKLKNGREN